LAARFRGTSLWLAAAARRTLRAAASRYCRGLRDGRQDADDLRDVVSGSGILRRDGASVAGRVDRAAEGKGRRASRRDGHRAVEAGIRVALDRRLQRGISDFPDVGRGGGASCSDPIPDGVNQVECRWVNSDR
jgi:hypothetical protein